MFDVNESTLRFWEKEFDQIRPRKTGKGTRSYRQDTFCENCETDVMIPIKELIMSAYDLRKQREEQDNW